ncbi:peptidoglycan DD-metalloendopeptidase family protein [Streptomyces sp. E11-3]|uniref:peptidoglycan DD-metalloendopeptidase family protein n=1 Tax=Streptomyces sp. E11-3 TaxID=3110112 RepID=UPI0039800743
MLRYLKKAGRPGHRLRTAMLACAATLALGATTVSAASAAPGDASGTEASQPAGKPAFQMPFACGTEWEVSAYDAGHNPALDIVVKDNAGSDGLPVQSSATGTVVATYEDSGSGNTIQIKHAGGWFTAYYHLKDAPDAYVKKGDQVTPSTQIGRIGTSGSNSEWSHLHYEQRYLPGGGDFTYEKHRQPVHFDGVLHTGVDYNGIPVTSNNCSDSSAWKDCPPGSVCFYSGADGTGSVCRTDRDDPSSQCGLRRSFFNNGTVQEGYDHVQVTFKEGGSACLHRGWAEGRGNFASGGRTIDSVRWRGECPS